MNLSKRLEQKIFVTYCLFDCYKLTNIRASRITGIVDNTRQRLRDREFLLEFSYFRGRENTSIVA